MSLHCRQGGRKGTHVGPVLPECAVKGQGIGHPQIGAQGQRAQRTGLRNVLDETATDKVEPVDGAVPVPVRDTQEPRYVVPGTATEHAPAVDPPSDIGAIFTTVGDQSLPIVYPPLLNQ